MENIDHSKNSSGQLSPDNQGILHAKPKDADEAAAEANRDIGVLLKVNTGDKKRKVKSK